MDNDMNSTLKSNALVTHGSTAGAVDKPLLLDKLSKRNRTVYGRKEL